MLKTADLSRLKAIARRRQAKDDPSHDFSHVERVTNLAIKIGKSVKADLDIVIPAALFHDTVVYPKDSAKSRFSSDDSAKVTGAILEKLKDYPKHKIEAVKSCIKECSFSKALKASSLESEVLQDADLLESTGAISIMRTFSSGGHMNRPFYDREKPLDRKAESNYYSGVAVFYCRLLLVDKRLHSKFAKKMAKHRTLFLKKFLGQLRKELGESGIV